MNSAWSPKPRLEDKQKKGDEEHLRFLEVAHSAIVEKKTAKKVSVERVEELRVLALDPKKALVAAKEKIKQICAELNSAGAAQFVINLILVNYRTAAGGIARKSRFPLGNSIASDGPSAGFVYARPSEGLVPDYIDSLLKVVTPKRGMKIDVLPDSVELTPNKLRYVPPSRFTVTFPCELGEHDHKYDTIRFKSVDEGGKIALRYSYMGSFGFAEPSYCWWKPSPAETPGTRLSVGAYSLNRAYLRHVYTEMEKLKQTPLLHEQSTQYGSVSLSHVSALLERMELASAPLLARGWIVQLAEMALALSEVALDQQPFPLPEGQREFLKYIRTKIEVRRERALSLDLGEQISFDYLWVFESTLWELAFLNMTCLPLTKIAETLKKLDSSWAPTVGSTNEHAIIDTVACDTDKLLRVYFPSGTNAATSLNTALVEAGYLTWPMGPELKELNTFTPYFEFYQYETSILNPKNFDYKTPEKASAQLWINLSEGLHGELLAAREKKGNVDVGECIAERLLEHLIKLKVEDGPLVLVIDFTKFAAETPNACLYPWLMDLAAALRRKRKECRSVVLRSNLKYNAGSLDRYQSGEILLDPKDFEPTLVKELLLAAGKHFEGDSSLGDWTFGNEYIPMMKKLYLLCDAVSWGRWSTYQTFRTG